MSDDYDNMDDPASSESESGAFLDAEEQPEQEDDFLNLEEQGEENKALKGDETTPKPTSSLEALPVRVDFELGHIELPLSELKNISEGYIFTEMANLTPSRIYAKSGNRVFAEGELVEFSGRIGFRVLKLYGKGQ